MDKNNSNILAKLFFGAIAIWAVPLYQGGKWLAGKALDGLWGGLLAFFIGLPLSIAGGIYAGNWVGWKSYAAVAEATHGWMPFFLWAVVGVIAGAIAWWVLLTYAWSLFYLVGLKPVTKAVDGLRHFFDDVARAHYAKLEKGFLGAVKTVFQPSSLWTSVQEKDKTSNWVQWLFGAVGYLSLVLGSIYLGWLTLSCVESHLAAYMGVYAWLPAALATYFVVFTVGPFLADFMEYARLSFTSLILGAVTAYALMPLTAQITRLPADASFGQSTATYTAIFAVEALAVVAYIFPMLYLLLTGGFLQRIADGVRKLFDGVLDEKKTNFRRLLHEVATLGTVYQFTKLSLMLAAAVSLPHGWTVALAISVMVLTYLLVGAFLEVGRDWSIGNSVIGVVAAAHAGGYAGVAFAKHGLLLGNWGGIVAGVVVFLASFCVVYPLLYRALRFAFDLTAISYLGVPFGYIHDKAWVGFRWVWEKFERVYTYGYWNDRQDTAYGDYRKMFPHAVNLLVSPTAGFVAGALLWKALGFASVLSIPAGVLLAVLAYLLLGQVVTKGGTHTVGATAAVIAGCGAGSAAYQAAIAHQMLVAFAAGVLAWLATYFLVFPAAYLALRFLTGWSTALLLPLLSGLYETLWKAFDKLVWQPFLVVYRFVRDYFWKPVWTAFTWVCGRIWDVWLGIWNGVKDAWNSMFGRGARNR